jgi:uncharacterized protein (TIRG00374 family)
VSPRTKRWAVILLRIALTAVALVIVVRMIDLRRLLEIFEAANKLLLIGLVLALLIPCLILGLRWWLLLRGHGFDVTFGRAFFVTYAGIFFNNFLPGGVGGDLTKAILVSAGEERKAAAVGTVVLDRLVGLAVLIFLGAACLAPFVGRFESSQVPILVFGLAGGVILAYLLYFSETLRGLMKARLPFRETTGQLDGVFRLAKDRKPLMAATAGLSLLSQVISILIIVGLARSLGIQGTPMWTFFVFEPIIFIVVALPISVGGLGAQEWAYAYLFGTFAGMDPNQAVALSILYRLSLILISIPGGLLFALGATKRPVSVSAGTNRVHR